MSNIKLLSTSSQLDMIDKMIEQHKSRRNQFQNEEIFEPIEIDFGYEDAVAFDSDKGSLKDTVRSEFHFRKIVEPFPIAFDL